METEGKRGIRRAWDWLQRHGWEAVGALAVLAFALGARGYWLHMTAKGVTPSFWDVVYFSLRLFGLDFDLPGGDDLPYANAAWGLQIARFLAPATLAIAVVKGVMLAASRQINVWAISRWKGHAVVCGAGERGRQLALALRRHGKKVVVIEKDEQADNLADIRQAGARVIIGSGTDAARQAEARMDTAELVMAVMPCEESNLDVVLAASRRRNGLPLKALAHATRSFAEMFENRPEFSRVVDRKECGFFDHDVAASRLVVGQYAPNLVPVLFEGRRQARILLAGDGAIVPKLLGIVVAQCQYAGAGRPEVTVLFADEDSFAKDFPLYHPQLELIAACRKLEVTLPKMLRLDLAGVDERISGGPFDLAVVACREDTDTLSLARNFAQQADCVSGNVIAGLRPSTQLMRMCDDKQPLVGVIAHDLVALGCSGDIVLHGRLDRVAQGIHDAYFASEISKGEKRGSRPTLVEWHDLPEGMRQSNRSQADHIPIKERTLGLSHSEDTIELLAIAEHRRWMAERIVAGWRHGPSRDDARRLHPSIKPYEELSEGEKQKDRDTVRKVHAEMGRPALAGGGC